VFRFWSNKYSKMRLKKKGIFINIVNKFLTTCKISWFVRENKLLNISIWLSVYLDCLYGWSQSDIHRKTLRVVTLKPGRLPMSWTPLEFTLLSGIPFIWATFLCGSEWQCWPKICGSFLLSFCFTLSITSASCMRKKLSYEVNSAFLIWNGLNIPRLLYPHLSFTWRRNILLASRRCWRRKKMAYGLCFCSFGFSMWQVLLSKMEASG